MATNTNIEPTVETVETIEEAPEQTVIVHECAVDKAVAFVKRNKRTLITAAVSTVFVGAVFALFKDDDDELEGCDPLELEAEVVDPDYNFELD